MIPFTVKAHSKHSCGFLYSGLSVQCASHLCPARTWFGSFAAFSVPFWSSEGRRSFGALRQGPQVFPMSTGKTCWGCQRPARPKPKQKRMESYVDWMTLSLGYRSRLDCETQLSVHPINTYDVVFPIHSVLPTNCILCIRIVIYMHTTYT